MARALAEGDGGGVEGVLIERASCGVVHEACVREEKDARYLCRGNKLVLLSRADDEEVPWSGAVLVEIDKHAKFTALRTIREGWEGNAVAGGRFLREGGAAPVSVWQVLKWRWDATLRLLRSGATRSVRKW